MKIHDLLHIRFLRSIYIFLLTFYRDIINCEFRGAKGEKQEGGIKYVEHFLTFCLSLTSGKKTTFDATFTMA